MKKAVMIFSIMTVLMIGGCAGEGGLGNDSSAGGRGRLQSAQSSDDEDGVYDIERIYTDDLMREIVEGDEMPIFVGYGLGGESGYVSAMSDDPEIIDGFIEAFREVKIGSTKHDSTDMYVADGGEDIVFVMEDGRQFNIAMDGRIWIHTDDVVFELGNTAKLSEMCVMMQEIAYMNESGGNVPDDYIAVIRGGVGEKTVETYVYETDGGYKYINVTSATVSWGSPKWDHVVDNIGTVSTKEEVIEKAKEHGADSCVTFPGESDAHPISDFL